MPLIRYGASYRHLTARPIGCLSVIDEVLRGEWNGFLVYPRNPRISSSFDRRLLVLGTTRWCKWIGVSPSVRLRAARVFQKTVLTPPGDGGESGRDRDIVLAAILE